MAETDYYKILGVEKSQLAKLANEYHVRRMSLFGSYLTGQQTKNSDIDIVVVWEKPPNLNRFFGLKEDLEKLTNKQIDLVTEDGMFWYIKDKVLKEAKSLYERP